MISDQGFKALGLGFTVKGLAIRVQGLRSKD